ncbi:Spy/CpxP family protein refolding chaperone [Roseicella aerolata]|uniref:Spy/CpxP family protein refolding chaperone n=1 Tax=Roseicella aerolata TaxID=2883479 RepID=A0A9X1IHU1_9PROT|nr:Spy/CpxP family protein refolding chaperone [Roseicella aerolata]MCB4824877.1 Spy/CpxP family protein refolding chaperone [Roseicella aerolata]
MSMRRPLLPAATLAVLLPLSSLGMAEEAPRPPLRLAMMDMEMMPMGGGGMQQQGSGGMRMDDDMRMGGAQAQTAQGNTGMPGMGTGGMADDRMMRMGGGMPAQGQMPMGQMPQQQGMGQGPMAGCMTMMQNMGRMGAAQPGMAPMQGAGTAAPSMGMSMGAMGGTQAMGSSAARLEGRIAFLRSELRITDAQAAAWDTFANTLRSGREHLDAARAALQEGATAVDPMARLESHERHLRERAEAMHMTRMAFNTLYAQLDDAQKRVAASTMLPFIGAF